MATINEPRSTQTLFFDPDQHPEGTLKAFEEFIQIFQLRYNAQYPGPPRVSLEAAIERWKFVNTMEGSSPQRPNLDQYDQIQEEWRNKDRVAKLLGMFSSNRLYTDWCVAQPKENDRTQAGWPDFIVAMRKYYKPTENSTLKNFHFRSIAKNVEETFPAFCNRVQKEANYCNFKCTDSKCTAEEISVRDQIVVGTHSDHIRNEALKMSWDLAKLRTEGMKMESAARGGAEIAGEAVNKLGRYCYQNIRKDKEKKTKNVGYKKAISCYNCGSKIHGSIKAHKEHCQSKHNKCRKCNKTGHFAEVCKSSDVRKCDPEEESGDDNDVYDVNLFHIKTSTDKGLSNLRSPIQNKRDFKVQVVINNHLDSVIADTGARVSVCGTVQAKKWNLLNRMT